MQPCLVVGYPSPPQSGPKSRCTIQIKLFLVFPYEDFPYLIIKITAIYHSFEFGKNLKFRSPPPPSLYQISLNFEPPGLFPLYGTFFDGFPKEEGSNMRRNPSRLWRHPCQILLLRLSPAVVGLNDSCEQTAFR